MCMTCSGKSNPNNGRKTVGNAVRTTGNRSTRTVGNSPYGMPKIRVSYGAKSRGR